MGISIVAQPTSAADPAITQTLADYVLSVTFESLPAQVRTESVRTVVNWVGCALGGAPGTGSSGGWYITGVTGGIGAAAAVGRLLGLNRKKIVSAMGLAAAQSCGVHGTHASMACAYVPAVAAQAGFTAAMLAQAGFECSPAAVTGRNGVIEGIAPNADYEDLCRDLGKNWELLGNAYKPYPCGIVIHPAIDA